MSRQDQFDFLFKIVMIGDSGVGKTNLLSRFIDGSFSMDSKPTIGVQFATKTINVQNKTIKNQIWDTAGQQRFRAITNAYYRGAVGAIIAFDLTKSKTFQNVQKWLIQLKQNAQSNIVVMLLGNKSDLQGRQVKSQSAEDFASTNKLIYLQTSAASGSNVQQAFTTLIKEIYQKMKQIPQQKKITNEQKKENQTTISTQTKQSVKQKGAEQKNKKNIKLQGQKKKDEKKKGCC